MRRALQDEVLHVRIRNHGEQELVNVPLRLDIDGRQRAVASFSVAGGAVVDTTLRFLGDGPGDHWGVISVNDQPVVFDDQLYIAYHVSERLRVLLVSGGDAASDRAIGSVFGNDSTHRSPAQEPSRLGPGRLKEQDLVILNALPDVPSGLAQALTDGVANGTSLCVFPPSGGDPVPLCRALHRHGCRATGPHGHRPGEGGPHRPGGTLLPRHLPEHAAQRGAPRGPRTLERAPGCRQRCAAALAGRRALPGRSLRGEGSVYLWATPLAEKSGNLTRHSLFATSLLRMAELSGPMGALYHTIGDEASIPLAGSALVGEAPPHLKGPRWPGPGARSAPHTRPHHPATA